MKWLSTLVQDAHWVWIAVGIFLCAAEAVAPGLFFLWIGVAAIFTGVIVAFVPLSFTWSLLIFAIFCIMSVVLGRRFYGSGDIDSDQPFLNRRADSFVGREYVLGEPIKGGKGALNINDTTWRVRGPDMPAGVKVRVTGVEDAVILIVEQA